MTISSRLVLGHNGGGARFEPASYTFFVDKIFERLSNAEFTNSFFKHHESHSMIINLSGQKQLADSVHYHELCHWYQYGGTTLGSNLTLTQYLKDTSGADNFRTLPKDECKHLIDERNTGHALIPLKDGYHLPIPVGCSPSWGMIRQIHYDYKLYEHLMFAPPPVEQLEHVGFVGDVIGEVNGDLIVLAEEL